MSTQDTSYYQQLINLITDLPLWVKQVFYIQLQQSLGQELSKGFLDSFQPDDMLQLWIPQLTFSGKRQLESATPDTTPETLKLLNQVFLNKSVLEICMSCQWTLAYTCTELKVALEKTHISPPESAIIIGTLEFLAGHIRIGQYLVKIGRLTTQQLDQALRTQHYIQESLGERTGIANVLINLGLINREDTEGILFLKEESKKTFYRLDLGGDSGGGRGGAQDAIDQKSKSVLTRNYEILEKHYRASLQENEELKTKIKTLNEALGKFDAYGRLFPGQKED